MEGLYEKNQCHSLKMTKKCYSYNESPKQVFENENQHAISSEASFPVLLEIFLSSYARSAKS